MEVVETIAGILIPGVGPVITVLKSVYALCDEVSGGKEACVHLHGRLQTLLDELEKMRSERRLATNEPVLKFLEALGKYHKFLTQYRDMNVVDRLIHHRKLKSTLGAVNEDVDALFRMLNLAAHSNMMEWRGQWEDSMRTQEAAIARMLQNDSEILDELRDTRDKLDTMLLLKAEIQQMQGNMAEQSAEVLATMQAVLRTLVLGATKDVGSVPEWFVPETWVTYDFRPFSSGSYAENYHGKWGGRRGDGGDVHVVIKRLLPDQANGLDLTLQECFVQEANRWFEFDHPHVLKMFGACHVSARPYIICEFADHYDMAKYLAKLHGLEKTRQLWRLIHQAAKGLAYLHAQSIVHGAVKLSNILVTKRGTAHPTALVADFGLSRVKDQSRSTSVSRLANGEPVRGDLRWRAPEQFTHRPQFSTDVYALGMSIIEAFGGEAPYGDLPDSTIEANIKCGMLPARPEGISDDGWDLITQMTVFDLRARPTMTDVVDKLAALAQGVERTRRTAELGRECVECGQQIGANAVFCQQCGVSVSTASKTASPYRKLELLSNMAREMQALCVDERTAHGA